MQLEQFLEHFDLRGSHNGTFQALCPAHEDSDPSLSISQGDKGIVITCHSGCTTEAVLAAKGLKLSDLFDNPTSQREEDDKSVRNKGGLTMENLARAKGLPIDLLRSFGCTTETQQKDKDSYILEWTEVKIPYIKADGIHGRSRRRMSLGGKRKHCWSQGQEAITCYGLQHLQLARDAKYIVLVEGESDVWTLHHHGYPALGIPGAKMAKRLTSGMLKDIERVYIFQEPGDGGESFVAGCKKQILSFKRFEGEIYSMKLDQDDPSALHLEAANQFRSIFDAALTAAVCLSGASSPNVGETEYTGLPLTDTGNAERLMQRHGDKLRYLSVRGEWLIWDGRHWRKGNHKALITETTRSIAGEAASLDDPELADALRQHSKRSESASAIRAIDYIGSSMMSIDHTSLDSDPMLFNCENGIIDLETGELMPHDPDKYQTCLANVTYDPDATCPRWEQFVLEVMSGDRESAGFLQRVFGYTLTGRTDEEVMFFLYGGGRNGKTKMLEVIRKIMGSYSEAASMGTLIEDPMKRSGPSNDVAKLAHARYVTYSESSIGQHLDEALVKALTGNDLISARFLHKEFFSFTAKFKLFMVSNHKPRVKGGDDGIWSRILLIPFLEKFEGEKRDPKLFEKLISEKSGILNWMLKGCLEWQNSGLNVAGACKMATSKYQEDSDLIGQFVDSELIQLPGERETVSDTYEIYQLWCKKSGENPFSKRNFNVRLEEKGFVKLRGNGNVLMWEGFSFKTHEDDNAVSENSLEHWWDKM